MASRLMRGNIRFICRDAHSMGVTLALSVLVVASGTSNAGPSESASAGTEPALYTNPVLFADYSDPDVVRVGDDFYMVSSSFHCVPGLPVLHSRDLVHWQIVSHALMSLPSTDFDVPQHGRGVWAPSIRYHNEKFWIYYGDPDRGIYLVKASHVEGPWEPAVLVQKAVGWIDP
jgi:beta-xylosidase